MEDLDPDLPPHDGYFKAVFSNLGTATALFQHHLPAKLCSKMEWHTLQLMPSSFVKQSLHQAHSDLIFSLQVEGQTGYIFLLLEHQTRVDAHMPVRLLHYTTEVFRQHLKERGFPLPLVVPMVLHQGPERWTPSPQFSDHYGVSAETKAAAGAHLLDFRHVLLDLSLYEPADDEPHPNVRLALKLMKLARTKQVLDFLHWMDQQVIHSLELLRISLLYALHVEPNIDRMEQAAQILHNPTLRSEVMSAAQTLIARGEARGKALGRLQLLRSLMGLPELGASEVEAMTVEELEARFSHLEAEYNRQFKRT